MEVKSLPGRSLSRLLLYISACLMIGFIAGEIMGAALVARSNKELLREQEWIEKNGYIAVPGTGLRQEMTSLKTYLAGGLFFSLSLGLCYAFVWSLLLWGFYPWKRVRIVISLCLLVSILIIFFTVPGWQRHWPFGFFLIIVPLLIYTLSPLFRPEGEVSKSRLFRDMPYIAGMAGAFLVVYILIAPSLTGRDFVRVRDGFFGRNTWGKGVIAFYYHYTLYPAEVIKAFDQRLQKAFRIDNGGFKEEEAKQIAKVLRWRDIFTGGDCPGYDLIRRGASAHDIALVCSSPHFIVEGRIDKFLANPRGLLDQYNKKSDSATFLRETVGWSLFEIWPLMGIFMIFSLLLSVSGLIFKVHSPVRDSILAFLTVCVLVICLRYYLKPKGVGGDPKSLLAQIEGTSPGDRIQAIIALWDRIEGGEVLTKDLSPHFIKMFDDPDSIIKKWGITFLEMTGDRSAAEGMIHLLKDPDPDVAYHAARSLGRLRATDAKSHLLELVKGDSEWYLRTTAYIALREMGWRQ